MQTASSSSPVPPEAPAAPMMVPSLSLITTAPVCGMNLMEDKAPKNCGLPLARSSRVRLATPMPTAANALPTATSLRSMLASSWRCSDFTLPPSSSTATASGFTFISRALANATSMILLACSSVNLDMRSPRVGLVLGGYASSVVGRQDRAGAFAAQFEQRGLLEIVAIPGRDRRFALAEVGGPAVLLGHRQVVARHQHIAGAAPPELPDHGHRLRSLLGARRHVGGARQELGAVLGGVAGEDEVARLVVRDIDQAARRMTRRHMGK